MHLAMREGNSFAELPTYTHVLEAHDRIRPRVHRTAVLESSALNELAEASLFFKAEHLQRTGSFKIRGAMNAVYALDEASAYRGVVTHSSGNHGQALALAARTRGIACHVVVPKGASEFKISAIKSYGANVSYCEPTLEERINTANSIVKKCGGTLVPPFDHPSVIAGQGTMALEFVDQVKNLDSLIMPIGGGGLASGVSIVCKALCPSIRLVGSEPAGADDAYKSFYSGKFIPQLNPLTIADGLRTSLGRLTWPILRDSLDEIITVSEDEIVNGMKLIFDRTKQLIEPSSGVPVAAALREGNRLGKNVGVILCGGNIDTQSFYEWLLDQRSGLSSAGSSSS